MEYIFSSFILLCLGILLGIFLGYLTRGKNDIHETLVVVRCNKCDYPILRGSMNEIANIMQYSSHLKCSNCASKGVVNGTDNET